MIDAPNVLTTSRLVLAPPVLADFEESAALWGDVEVMRYVGGAGLSRSMVWAGFLRQAGSWAMLGYGGWIVRERITGRFVGEVAFGDKMREVTPAFADPEAGWVLATWAHGQGFATEAVAATHAWSDARFKGARTVCMIDPRNEPSLRLAAKMGYAQFGRSAFRDGDVVLLQRPTLVAQSR